MKPISKPTAANALLVVVTRLLGDITGPERPWPSRIATTAGFPASAADEECPRCRIEWGTTWLYGDNVLGLNWWVHDSSGEPDVVPCGLVWPTRIRRPGNGIRFVIVDHGDTNCLFCGERRVHPTEVAAKAYSVQHTAMHEQQHADGVI